MSAYCGYLRDLHGLAASLRPMLAALALLHPAWVWSQAGDAAASQAAGPTIAARWQSYDLRFHYFGFTTYYSCSGLEDRLEEIFRKMGADKDMQVMATGCHGPGFHDINNMLSARIRVRLPVGVEEQPTFQAVRKPVALQTRSLGAVGAADCELLEQVRNQLLPAVNISVLKDELRCVPGQVSVGSQTLQVMALLVAPAEQP